MGGIKGEGEPVREVETNQYSKAEQVDPATRTDSSVDAAQNLGQIENVEAPPAGALHTTYLDKSDKQIDEQKALADKATIRQTSIRDLRKNSRVLNKKPADNTQESELDQVTNLKDETARRLRVYTKARDGEWYTLDYKDLGADSEGATHEFNVGLGDILLDTDIQEVLIQKRGSSKPIKCHRGIADDRKHKGRVGFLDKEGHYVATHTNDKFRILTGVGTDLTVPKQVTKCATAIKIEDEARATQEINLRVKHDFGTIDTEIPTEESDIDSDPEVSVVDQIKIKLSPSKRAAAETIEKTFIEEGITNRNLIAAAIINAERESSLNPEIIGDNGNSVGLFQLNSTGDGAGMSMEDKQDPVKNTKKIIAKLKSDKGSTLRSRATAGASVQELTYIFARDMEQCVDEPVNGYAARAKASLDWFNKKDVVPTEDYLVKNYTTANGEVAELSLRSNQETWIIGSSIAAGLGRQNQDQNIGTFGIIGGDPVEIGNELENNLKPRIAKMQKAGKMTLPKRVILIGMALNGLSTNGNTEDTVRDNLAGYEKIASILEGLGISEVKFSPENLYQGKLAQVKAFNEAVKKIPARYLDTGIDSQDTELTSDTLHLQTSANQKVFDAEKKLRG